MKAVASYFSSTIGRKQLVGLTGLGLTLFVIGHVTGNFLMFVSAEAYNLYGHKLTSNPLIYAVEAGLLALFAVHLLLALRLQLLNFSARKNRYAIASHGAKATSVVTKTLWAQGIVIAVFAILHLIAFKFGPAESQGYVATYDGVQVRDLFRLVAERFKEPGFVAWYVVAMVILGFHLAHGVASSLQTMGLNHPRYSPLVKRISLFVAVYVALGFISQPIYMFFFYKG